MSSSINQSMVDQFNQIRLENYRNQYLHPSYILERQLMEAMKNGHLTKATNILKSINQNQKPKIAPTSLRSLKNSLICSATLFTRAIIYGGVDPETAFNLSDAYILEIERKEDFHSLYQLEYDMLTHFIELLNEQKTLPYGQIVNQSIQYIHDHILEELSLEVIASQSYISPSYLSHLFKKEVGESIIQFINRKRVEESKYFLLYTSTSISDIAILFHFCNQSYFTSLFKKFTELTPKEFREQYISF
ncbi:AraC family transcriptional regulator [Pontibacillus sp. HMF3514]|uniref:AraC family transcriptional regulator n=1 Tax=Pontibacillus sp. HMF3514 TaxID=2692425 RepID=UPI00131FE152|nr:AraC family transcriptional regulator [Pontibacillus sp. HMF3514]QHE51250.1 AraC family transcriptional regulator [Pontibacillus sp. HMF3514]